MRCTRWSLRRSCGPARDANSHRGEQGQAAMAIAMTAALVMVLVPVGFEVMAVDQGPTSAKAVFSQAATSAATAGVQDYIDHLQAAQTAAQYQAGTAYAEKYCSSQYQSVLGSMYSGCATDANNPAFLNDDPNTQNDVTNPAGATKWASMPTSKSSPAYTYNVVEAYNYLVDVPAALDPATPGNYDVVVYATGRAGNAAGGHYVYKRIKAVLQIAVTAPSGPATSQPVSFAVATCSGTPPSTTATTVQAPSWAHYALVTLAGAAGGSGYSTSLDTTVPSGGAGASFTASVPVQGLHYYELAPGCSGQGNNTGVYGGGGYTAGGDGSRCDTSNCGNFFGGGDGGGGGGASAFLDCAADGTCSSPTPLAIAGAGGGGGGDAVLAGATGGSGGSAAFSCTTATGCDPLSLGGVATGSGYAISGSSGGSGSGIAGGNGAGGAAGTASGGPYGAGGKGGAVSYSCGQLLGSGCNGGTGGTVGLGATPSVGSAGQLSSDCTNHAPSGCAGSGNGSGAGGGEAGLLVGGVLSGAGGGGGGGYGGGGGGGGGGSAASLGSGAGGGGAGSSYLYGASKVEPYSAYANSGNGIAYVTFFSNAISFNVTASFSSSQTWNTNQACVGQMSVKADGAAGWVGGNNGGASGAGAEITATVPAPAASLTDCVINAATFVSATVTVGGVGGAAGNGVGGAGGTGFGGGGAGSAGACSSPNCGGGGGGGSSGFCYSATCTSSSGTPLVVAGGGGGGGGKASGGNGGGQGGAGGLAGANGSTGNGGNAGPGGTGGSQPSAGGQGGQGTANNGSGGGGGGGAGYSAGGGGGTSGGYTLIQGAGGGGGGGGGNSYPAYAATATNASAAGAIVVGYAYTSTTTTDNVSGGPLAFMTQVAPDTAP